MVQIPKNQGPFLGVLTMRIIVYWDLSWGPLFLETPMYRNFRNTPRKEDDEDEEEEAEAEELPVLLGGKSHVGDKDKIEAGRLNTFC